VKARIRRFAAVALAPTLVDVALLVFLRQSLGWILVVADLVAIAAASAVSYALHRTVTFHSDPYVRWVHIPVAFVGVAVVAALVDVIVLRALFAGTGFESTGALVEAKVVALVAAGAVRLVGYRWVLVARLTRARRQRWPRPDPPGDRRLTVVVPAYGEADRIAESVRRIHEELSDIAAGGGLEVVVVDDGSTDGTADAALSGGADQVIVQPHNRGKGAAVRMGVMAARGRAVAFLDADLAYAPDQVRRVLAAIEDGWDVAIGDRGHSDSRTLVAASRLRAAGSRAINLLVYAVLLGSYRDTQCGLKGFRSDVARFVFDQARVDGFAFDIEVLHLVERHQLSLVEVPVEVANSDRSTVRAAREATRLIADLFRIRHWAAEGRYEGGDIPAPARSAVSTPVHPGSTGPPE
jgi:dolichyl-phosphate beta-glucosyltransferase